MKSLYSSILVILLINILTYCNVKKLPTNQKGESDTVLIMKNLYGSFVTDSLISNFYSDMPELVSKFNITPNIKLSATLLKIAKVEERGIKQIYVLTCIKPQKFDCHFCGPVLEAIIYNIDENGELQLASRDFLGQFGSWGEAPPFEFKKIGVDRYAYIFRTGSTKEGITSENLEFFAPIEQHFREVLSLKDVYMDNLGICDSTKGDCWAYNYKYRLIESKRENDFFEIVIIKEGSKEIENRIVKINDSIYYEFKDGYYNEVAPK